MALSQEQLDAIEAQLNTIRGSVSDITQQYKATGNTSPTSDYTALQSASDIKQQPAFQYNETTGTEPDISGSVADIAGYKASTKSLQDSIARFQAQYEANQKQSESILDKISGKKSVTDYQTEIKNQLGYDPEQYLADRQTDIAEIESLQKTYETALQSKQMALLNDQSQAATTGFVNKAMNRTEKEFNIKLNSIAGAINTKNAIISLKDQSYEKATNYINKAVENYTAKLKNEVDQYEQLRQDNAELLAEMSDVDIKIFDAAQAEAEREYETRKMEMNQIGSLMTKYADAGWTTNDLQNLSLGEALEKASMSPTYQNEQISSEMDIYAKQADIDKTYAQIENLSWDNMVAQATIAQKNLEIQSSLNDINSGVLDEKEIKAIDTSPQGKKLQTLSDLKQKVKTYKTLVEQEGYAMTGAGRTLLENAYADLKIAWKEAANLGALTGPDVSLISDAVKPATGWSGLGTQVFGGGTEGIKKGIDQMLQTILNDGLKYTNQLNSRNSKYKGSEYVDSITSSFRQIKVISPDGQIGYVTADELDQALSEGYKLSQ